MKHLKLAIAGGLIAALAAVGVVSAHNVTGISASAECSGATTVLVQADVYDGHRLVVSIDGNVISDAAYNGTSAVQTFTFTTTTQPGGHTASAKTEQPNGTLENGPMTTQFSTPEACATPTPSPTPTPTPSSSPTPSPSASPSPSPSASPVPSIAPTPSPVVTPPATDETEVTTAANVVDDASWIAGFVALFAISTIGIVGYFTARSRR